MGSVKKVVVVNCMGTGDEAIYVDGQYKSRDSVIYAHDIVTAVGGTDVPFVLSQEDVEEAPDPWPQTLDEVMTHCNAS